MIATGNHPVAIRVASNFAKLVGGKSVAAVLGLAYLALTARMLGIRDFGTLALVSGYVVFVGNIVAFSGFHGLVKYGAIRLANGDKSELAILTRFAAMLELGLGLCAIILTMVTIPLFGSALGWSQETIHIGEIFSLSVIATVRATPQGLLQLDRRFDLISLHQIVSPLVRLVGTVILWFLGYGLDAILILWLLSSVAEFFAMWLMAIIAWKNLGIGEPFIGPWRPALRDNPGFGRFAVITNMDITLREVFPSLVPLAIGWLIGPAATGVFAIAQRLSASLQQPALLLAQASYSTLAELAAGERVDALVSMVWRMCAVAAALGTTIVAIFILLGDRILYYFAGQDMRGSVAVLVLVAMSRAIGLATVPITAGFAALGKPGRSVSITVAANILFLPVLVILLRRLGVAGAGWHAGAQAAVIFVSFALLFARDGDVRTSRAHDPAP